MTPDSTDRRASLLRDVENWPLCYHTVRNMHSRQLAGILERKLRHLVVPRLPVDFDARYEQRVPDRLATTPGPIRKNTDRLRRCLTADRRQECRGRVAAAKSGDVMFLDESIEIDGPGGPDWFHPALDSQPALWALKLHGFEFLNWPVLGTETAADRPDAHSVFSRWIRDWATSESTEIGTGQYLRRAWTPHSVSLRLLNWCRYYGWCARLETREGPDSSFLATLRRLIYKNALFLERHVEYDVGGNHLIENGAALVVAGSLLDTAGQRFLETGLDVLSGACTQFLGDGGHFERSPMYHVITLTRYLTVLDVLRAAGYQLPAEIDETASAAVGFLRSIRPPDGRLPLLNDSVFGEALPLDSCLSYARSVGVTGPETGRRDALTATGLYWLGEGPDRLLVDGGAFGPPELPAHSHNDLFSVNLWVDGHRLLTDTGVFEYAPTPRRQQARSVRGHNTVQVGNAEPVDIGGQYLAGKRLQPRVRYLATDEVTMFDGSYRKQGRDGGYKHRRRIFADADWWLVQDAVSSREDQRVRSRLHFHPDVTVQSRGEHRDGFELSVDGTPAAYLLPVGVADVARTTSPYFPEFGVEVERAALVLENPPGTDSHGMLFSKRPYSTEDVHRIDESVRDIPREDIEGPAIRLSE